MCEKDEVGSGVYGGGADSKNRPSHKEYNFFKTVSVKRILGD